MQRIFKQLSAIAIIVWFVAGAGSASAGTSFDFLFSMDHVTNDNQMFLNLTVSSYGYNRAVLEPMLPRIRYVEADLPVILFLSRECGRPVNAIVDLRAQGLTWSVIFGRFNVPMDVLFVGIEQDPGPPYGRAWGHWKRNRSAVKLSDSDIQGLVQVRLGSSWTNMSAYQLARAQGEGKSVVKVVAEKKGRPYDKGVKPSKSKSKGKGRGNSKH